MTKKDILSLPIPRSREYIVYRRSMSSGRVGGDPSQVKSAVRREWARGSAAHRPLQGKTPNWVFIAEETFFLFLD